MFDIRRRTGYLFLAIMIGHVILISAQVPTKAGPKVLDTVVLGVFGDIERAAAALTGSAGGFWEHYVDLRNVRDENEALRRQLDDLQVQLQEERALAQRAANFQQLLDLKTAVTVPTLAAQVIGADATTGFRTITIDRGARDGVRTDMAVIAPRGVIGRVVGTPVARAAQVQLLIGRDAAAGALIERSRAAGMVVGGGLDPPLTMEYVSNLADVREGDMVVTSGIDGIYPKGFPIGRVESAARGPSLYQVIKVRPLVDFSSIEEVLVVLSRPAPALAGPGDQS